MVCCEKLIIGGERVLLEGGGLYSPRNSGMMKNMKESESRFDDLSFEIQAERFESGLRRRGIKVLFLDVDDTLVKTHDVFIRRIESAADILAVGAGMDVLEVRGMIFEAMGSLKSKLWVDPEVMPLAMSVVFFRLGLGREEREVLERAQDEAMQIYWNDLPVVCEEVEKAALVWSSLKEVRVIAATHADDRWTNFKLASNGLIDCLNGVKTITVNGPKGIEQWQQLIEEEGVLPSEVGVWGDSLQGDILAPLHAGVPETNLVKIQSEIVFGAHGELPAGVVEVKNVWEAMKMWSWL